MQDLVLDDVYDIIPTSFWRTTYGYVSIGILAIFALFIIIVLVKAAKRYRLGTTKDQALRKLRQLAQKIKKNDSDVKKIYQELTDLLKSYVQWRFSMPRGLTDYEMSALLKAHSIQDERVERVIADAQAVKFGQILRSKLQTEKDIDDIIVFVETTGNRPKHAHQH